MMRKQRGTAQVSKLCRHNSKKSYENPVFGRGGNSTQQRRSPLFRPETVSAANPCSRTKFMHIKCISDKKKFVGLTRSNILPWEVCPRTDFLAKFLALFEKAAGRGKCIVDGHTPNSRGINIYIKRVYQLNFCASFGRVGARARTKYFTCVLQFSRSLWARKKFQLRFF